METRGTVDFAAIDDRKVKYQEQLRLRRKYSNDAIAVAHYNVTTGAVVTFECSDQKMRELILTGAYENGMDGLCQNCFSPKDKELAEMIRDLTDTAVEDAIVETMLKYGYESIAAFDADNAKVHSFKGNHISDVINAQQKLDDNIAGVEVYIREHCVEPDVDGVIKETSLPFAEEKLNTMPVWTVPYSLLRGHQIVHRLTSYSYLDEAHNLIMRVMQYVSDAYRRIKGQIRFYQTNN